MSTFIHRIRLRRPWDRQSQCDRISWMRRFGRPGNLSPGEQVWLVLEEASPRARVVLNGQELGMTSEGGCAAFPVTVALAARNSLAIELPAGSGRQSAAEAPEGRVWLEIRRPLD